MYNVRNELAVNKHFSVSIAGSEEGKSNPNTDIYSIGPVECLLTRHQINTLQWLKNGLSSIAVHF